MVLLWYYHRRKSGKAAKYKQSNTYDFTIQNTLFVEFLIKIFVCFEEIAYFCPQSNINISL